MNFCLLTSMASFNLYTVFSFVHQMKRIFLWLKLTSRIFRAWNVVFWKQSDFDRPVRSLEGSSLHFLSMLGFVIINNELVWLYIFVPWYILEFEQHKFNFAIDIAIVLAVCQLFWVHQKQKTDIICRFAAYNPLTPTVIQKLLEIIGRVRLCPSCSFATALDSDINQTTGSGGHLSMWENRCMHAAVCLLRAGQPRSAGDAAKLGQFIGQFSWVTGDPIGVKGLIKSL